MASRKKKKEDAERRELRSAFLWEHGVCMACEQAGATDLHEICRGAHRHRAKLNPITWLALCRSCHDEMDDYSIWPLERQCAVKFLRDYQRFDLEELNAVRGRAPHAITMEDIIAYLELF